MNFKVGGSHFLITTASSMSYFVGPAMFGSKASRNKNKVDVFTTDVLAALEILEKQVL